MGFEVAQPFPAFEFPAVVLRDGEIQTGSASNQSLAGKPFVLWVFPKVATSGCTLEAREFSSLHAEFERLGVEVVGVSRDSSGAQGKFLRSEEIFFPLLADKSGAWMSEHGLIFEAKMYGKPVTRVARTTFLVDGDGVLRRVWEQVVPLGHASQVLEEARALVGN